MSTNRSTHPAGRDEPVSSVRPLTREGIVAAALLHIDRDGLTSLTMRKLAQGLGVEAMSLYHHVKGREDLLELIVADLLDGVTGGLDPDLSTHWQGFLQSVAQQVRRIALEHPNAFPLVATRHPAAPWLRPPLRSLELVSTFLRTLISHGFTDEQAVDTYRAFSSFLLGQLLLESAVRGADTAPLEEPLDEGGATITNRDGAVHHDPDLERLQPLLSADRSQEEFEITLETLLDRIDRDVSQ